VDETVSVKVSFIVCTYGRDASYRRLINSIRNTFKVVDYEIVTVASDDPTSEKCIWASQQKDIKLICVGDRKPNEKRKKSLYFYENIAIEAASGDWLFITNDDTEFTAGSESGFIEKTDVFDVIVAPAEIDDPALGKRAPVIGTLQKGTVSRELMLLDFAFIKSTVMERIGPADENLDWYGGGVDRSILVGLQDNVEVGVLSKGGLTHHLELENRTPPHSIPDFHYLAKKWKTFQAENPDTVIDIEGGSTTLEFPMWFYKRIWPILSKVKRRTFG
jgi:glycosyltransferase involved in cell wall biosynthesis